MPSEREFPKESKSIFTGVIKAIRKAVLCMILLLSLCLRAYKTCVASLRLKRAEINSRVRDILAFTERKREWNGNKKNLNQKTLSTEAKNRTIKRSTQRYFFYINCLDDDSRCSHYFTLMNYLSKNQIILSRGLSVQSKNKFKNARFIKL